MRPELIQAFIIKYGDCFDSSTIMEVQRRISTLDDTQAPILMSMNLQKPTIILIILIFKNNAIVFHGFLLPNFI